MSQRERAGTSPFSSEGGSSLVLTGLWLRLALKSKYGLNMTGKKLAGKKRLCE